LLGGFPMNIPTIIIGVVALLIGISTTYLRTTKSDKLVKLKAIQEKFGEQRGALIHLVFYSIIPIIFGIIMVLTGMRGVSFF
jgi:hypothetical protein